MRVVRRSAVPHPKVRALMTSQVVAASPRERVTDVACRMRSRRVGALAVVEGGRLLGVMSERDLLRAVADGMDPHAAVVSDCMTTDPVTIGPDAEAAEAAELMIERWVRHLPVLEQGRVVGVISARDLLVLGRRPRLDQLACEPW